MILEQIPANFNMVRHAINVEFVTDKVLPDSVIMEDLYQPMAEMEVRRRIPSLANANPPITSVTTLDEIVTQLSLSEDERLSLKLAVVYSIAAKLVFAISERKSFSTGETSEEMLTIDWSERYSYLIGISNKHYADLGAPIVVSGGTIPVFEKAESERERYGAS